MPFNVLKLEEFHISWLKISTLNNIFHQGKEMCTVEILQKIQ